MDIQLCCILLWLLSSQCRNLIIFFEIYVQIPWNGVSLISFPNFRKPRYSFFSFLFDIPVSLLHIHCSKLFLYVKTFQLHYQFLPCVCQLILLIKDHPLHSHLFVCKKFEWIKSYNLLTMCTAITWIWVFCRSVLVTFHYRFYE